MCLLNAKVLLHLKRRGWRLPKFDHFGRCRKCSPVLTALHGAAVGSSLFAQVGSCANVPSCPSGTDVLYLFHLERSKALLPSVLPMLGQWVRILNKAGRWTGFDGLLCPWLGRSEWMLREDGCQLTRRNNQFLVLDLQKSAGEAFLHHGEKHFFNLLISATWTAVKGTDTETGNKVGHFSI